MRTAFLGVGLPQAWPPGSLRGDMGRGRSELRYRAGIEVGAARNGAHLSNGPVEALREVCTWFGREPADTAIGRTFVAAGVDPDAVLDAVYADPRDGRGPQPIAALTEHADAAQAAELLTRSTLLTAAAVDARSG